MQCRKCGDVLPDGTRVCPSCGEPVSSSFDPDLIANALPAASRPVVYAGFWIRGLAFVLDGLLIVIVFVAVILVPLMELGAIPANAPYTWFMAFNRQTIAIRLLAFMLSWLYFATMESSRRQATIGKKALGLVVTDFDGQRISFNRALWRDLLKIVFGMIFYFGFLFAAFMPRKQALHDILGKTLVLKRPRRN